MNGGLVFDITINREPGDNIPSCASVSCQSDTASVQQLTITQRWPEKPFEFKFRSGCYVSGYLQQQTPVHIDGIIQTAIFANIHYGVKGQGDDHHFEGLMVTCPMRGHIPAPPPDPFAPKPPTPIEPYPPVDPIEPIPFIISHPDELFPYVYVRRWPKVDAIDLQLGFIQYNGASPASSAFFEAVISARQQSRNAVQTLALQFIEGDLPYQGDFIGSMTRITGPVSQFPLLERQLPMPQSSTENWLGLVCEQITQLLARYAQTWDYLCSSDYAQTLDRVWQSYFALVITLGYDTSLLDELTRTLRLAHVIKVALQPGVDKTTDALARSPLTHLSLRQLQTLCQATPVLPALIFPLPSAQLPALSPPPAPLGWMEPYAIGDLQMVRQRLLRYQSGEIAHIENVMRGERREVTNKRTHRQFEQQKQSTAEIQVLQNDATDERSNLQEEARKTVAETTETNQYNKFTNSYGPPTHATLDGSWSKTLQAGADPGLDDTTRFARDILNKTVNRINRSVSQTRSSSTMSQTEDTVLSLIDNTTGAHSMRAVYRWLNKVYEACVVNYGQRLMMEFMVYKPASSFISQEHTLAVQTFVKPMPPLQLGVATFEDVTPSNYARLGALYGVLDVEPPPLAQRIACASLRSGQEKQIAIPAGYCATHAFVNYVSTPSGLPTPVVLVGRQAFSPTSTPGAATLNGEDDSVPISVLDYPPSLSPPSDAQVLVNVEITCVPSARCLDQWRIHTYASIVRAYDAQLAAYRAGTNHITRARGPGRSTLANRQIEQRELKHACLRLLLERVVMLTGSAPDTSALSPPSEVLVYEPRYLQFFDEVLEWGEMVYNFYAGPASAVGLEPGSHTADDDALFSSFLQADQARVLLPVQPAHVMAFLYFYSAGMLWTAPDQQAPVNPADIALVNDLKQSEPRHRTIQRVGPCWEVVVPTAMQVLDEFDADIAPRSFLAGGATS